MKLAGGGKATNFPSKSGKEEDEDDVAPSLHFHWPQGINISRVQLYFVPVLAIAPYHARCGASYTAQVILNLISCG